MTHTIGLYVERHDSRLHQAICSCGWRTSWISDTERDRLVAEHQNADQHLGKHE